jgi:hypothetical protein
MSSPMTLVARACAHSYQRNIEEEGKKKLFTPENQ